MFLSSLQTDKIESSVFPRFIVEIVFSRPTPDQNVKVQWANQSQVLAYFGMSNQRNIRLTIQHVQASEPIKQSAFCPQ